MSKLRIGVLFGGRSTEKEVSLNSGRHVFNMLDRSRFEPVAIFMDGDGRLWNIPLTLMLQNTTADVEARLSEADRVPYESLKERIDVAFLSTFGKYGEDGCLQGLLELLGIPYTGSSVLGAALGSDKAMQRVLMVENPKITIPPYLVMNLESGIKNYGSAITELLPIVVKPTREGSTMGVTVVKRFEDLEAAVKKAFEYDTKALVEPYLVGLEFSCVVLDGDPPMALPPTETLHTDEIFSYHDKYMPGASKKITPARVSAETLAEIQAMCVETFVTLGFSGYARIDGFVLTEELRIPENATFIANKPSYPIGTIFITDPNVFSGMAPSSWTFHQAAAVGITPVQLLSRIIDASLPST